MNIEVKLFLKTLLYLTLSLQLHLICPDQTFGKNNLIVIDNFEHPRGDLFQTWLLRNAPIKEANKIYKIQTSNNNRFLHAESIGTSIQIAKKVKWNIKRYPILTWRWRAVELAEGANEGARGRNDTTASIYVIFQRNSIPFLSWKYQPVNVIKYLWSTTLPIGKVVQKEKVKMGKTIFEGKYLVLQSGKKLLNKWISEKRNVLLDYINLFGTPPKYNPILIGILTDSNDTNSTAIADYDNLIIHELSQ
ncbi:MAG: DUF3047 domain-containing protein [Spirochaetota bacterium]|nr:DUF3047 domain-containing protein [Spirochaetota bacterium]